MTRCAFLFALVLVACGARKEEPTPAATQPAKPAATAPVPPGPSTTPPPAPGPASPIEARFVAMMEKTAKIFDAYKGDCARLAKELKAFSDANGAELDALTSWSKGLSEEEGTAVETRNQQVMDDTQQRMSACPDDKAVDEAMARFPH